MQSFSLNELAAKGLVRDGLSWLTFGCKDAQWFTALAMPVSEFSYWNDHHQDCGHQRKEDEESAFNAQPVSDGMNGLADW